MPKEEWGVKRVCPTTGKRFYDLNKNPIVSPYTGEVVVIETGNKSRTMLADKADPKAAKETESEDEDLLVDSEEDSEVDLDDDVLEDDDDDDQTVALDDLTDVAAKDDDD